MNATLADVALPQTRTAPWVRDLSLVWGGAAVTALAAQISIPWQPVPFTLQTMAVLACGLALGMRRGALSQIAYLGAGVMGLPVFAEGKFGIATLVGPTGGYLIGFVVGAAILGAFAERGWDRKLGTTALALLFGNLAILTLGTLWLSRFVGFEAAIAAGVAPFLVGDLLKNAIVLFGFPAGWHFARK